MSVRPTATSLPPSLREHSTGVAAWSRLVLLWAPMSLAVGLAVIGQPVSNAMTAIAGLAAAVATFVLAGSIEVHRAARRGASPLAAGALLATHAAVIVVFAGVFLALFIANG